MSIGIAFNDKISTPSDHVMLACHQRDQKLARLCKSLESIFHRDLTEEQYSVGLYCFKNHPEGLTTHYFVTDGGTYCFLVTSTVYNHRCASKMLNEFIELFVSNYKKKIPKCGAGDLSKPARSQFVAIFEKYEDVEGIDALMRSHQKLDEAKSVMSDNVSLLLENQDSVERVYSQSQDLNRDAALFKKNTKKLKYNLECRSRKVIRQFLLCHCSYRGVIENLIFIYVFFCYSGALFQALRFCYCWVLQWVWLTSYSPRRAKITYFMMYIQQHQKAALCFRFYLYILMYDIDLKFG
jgi:hypothetical protein